MNKPRPKSISAIDLDTNGASVISQIGSDPLRTHTYGSHPGSPTLVHSDDNAFGMPYRVDLDSPSGIERYLPPTTLSLRDMQHEDPSSAAAHWTSFAKASKYLLGQIIPHRSANYGIVIPDSLGLEAAETILRTLKISRSKISLIPWPIAACWSWLVESQELKIPQSIDRPSLIGTILTVYLTRTSFEIIPVHLAATRYKNEIRVVPARDRGDTISCMHNIDALESIPQYITAIENTLKANDLHQYNKSRYLGAAITGRPFELQYVQEIASLISRISQVNSEVVCYERSSQIGMLCRGSARAAHESWLGATPYFESTPDIELSGYIYNSYDPSTNYVIYQDIPYWIDALYGLEDVETIESAGHRRLLPANRRLHHIPNIPYLHMREGNRETLRVAFDRDVVRSVSIDIPGKYNKKVPVQIEVEYELGSGRPLLRLIRPGSAAETIVFKWVDAVEEVETRNDITRYDYEQAQAEHQRRVEERKKLGYSV
jgi:hypothetical protein